MNPRQYAQSLYEVLESRSEEQQDQIIERFKYILTKNKDSHLAGSIRKELEKIQEQKIQEEMTYITSASNLSDPQKQELESIFHGAKSYSKNPSLLGGIAVRKKDIIYNATLRKKIETLKSS